MSGSLDVILMRLAEFTEAQADLRAKVNSAMTYPIIMMVVTGGLLGFLFRFLDSKNGDGVRVCSKFEVAMVHNLAD